jgi:iron complex transport system ATP-binding protein
MQKQTTSQAKASSGGIAAVTASAAALETKAVSGRYSAGADVLCDVSVKLDPGEMLVVIGPNGAGKSTLIRLLSGTLAPRLGEVRLFGQDVSRMPKRQIAQQLAVVPQTAAVAHGFRVHDVVMMGRSPHQGALAWPSDADRAAVEQALDRAGIADLAGRRVDELSGGEQKLVAVARALAQCPQILLLDEASAHLDPRHAADVCELALAEVRARGMACLATMHDLNLAAAYADRVLLLKGGRIAGLGSVAEVMTAEKLEEAFAAPLRVGSDEGGKYFAPRRRIALG